MKNVRIKTEEMGR